MTLGRGCGHQPLVGDTVLSPAVASALPLLSLVTEDAATGDGTLEVTLPPGRDTRAGDSGTMFPCPAVSTRVTMSLCPLSPHCPQGSGQD